MAYVTKAGQTMKVVEDTVPYWISEGWALDQNRDGVPDELTPAVEGLPLTVFGASYEAVDLQSTGVATRYPSRVARRSGLTLANRAKSGDEVSDQYMHMSQLNATRRLAPGTKGIVQVGGSMNDVIRNWTSPFREPGFKAGLKACIYRAMLSSTVMWNDAAATYTAGWSNGSVAIGGGDFGGNMTWKQASAAGEKATITATGTDLVVFLFTLVSPTYAADGSPVTIRVDGTVVHNAVAPVRGLRTTQPAQFGATGWALPLFNLAPGAHTIEVESVSGALLALTEVGVIDRTSLPQVLVTKVCNLDPARPPAAGFTNEVAAAFRGHVDAVVAQILTEAPWTAGAITPFTQGGSYWNPVTMIGSDNLHPTDEGMWALARAELDVLAALPFRKGMNRL